MAASEPPGELCALLARFGLGEAAGPRLAALLDRLVGDPHAPTAVRERRAAVDDHLADSLVALELDAVRRAGAIADLGSGAGLPGLPLAVALPGAHVFLVESNLRKGRFIAGAAAACGLANATVVAARAEEWREGGDRCDIVTARALAPLDVVAEYAAPLLRIGGALVAWRGRRDERDEAAAARAAEILGLEVEEPVPVHPYPGAEHRHLHVLRKVAATPARFPRRPGVARKRPLGAARPPSDREPR